MLGFSLGKERQATIDRLMWITKGLCKWKNCMPYSKQIALIFLGRVKCSPFLFPVISIFHYIRVISRGIKQIWIYNNLAIELRRKRLIIVYWILLAFILFNTKSLITSNPLNIEVKKEKPSDSTEILFVHRI
jgi:hypothetical protein